ncbi:unnamed protein product [Lactuca virosa]|uniref:Uncharacterized protein n=1 Tax=Lactuca virosa TaxID=75947 RepID=A0AAU9MUJ9_9ASTR|nr:unnamed protein product [Lactuca virosa]
MKFETRNMDQSYVVDVSKKECICRGGEDVIMGDEANQDVNVNEDEVQVGKVEQPRKRKKSERILKMKLAKRIEGEGCSAAKAMELD